MNADGNRQRTSRSSSRRVHACAGHCSVKFSQTRRVVLTEAEIPDLVGERAGKIRQAASLRFASVDQVVTVYPAAAPARRGWVRSLCQSLLNCGFGTILIATIIRKDPPICCATAS